MSLTEETIKEIRQLSPRSLALIYNHIHLLKKNEAVQKQCERKASYLKVRQILSKTRGPLSEEIIKSREDRL